VNKIPCKCGHLEDWHMTLDAIASFGCLVCYTKCETSCKGGSYVYIYCNTYVPDNLLYLERLSTMLDNK
jgi:hypothetical protein